MRTRGCAAVLLALILTFPALAPAQATVSVQPASLAFRAVAGRFSPIPLNVTLVNPGTAEVAWQATLQGEMVFALPVTAGAAPPGSSTVQVVVNPGGLNPGTYGGDLWFVFTGISTPVRVPLRLTVDAFAAVNGPVTVNMTAGPYGSLQDGRTEPEAVTLPGGNVLIAGGLTFQETATTELARPDSVEPGPAMATARRRHTLTLLPSGDAVAAGGLLNGNARGETEIYRATAGVWAPATPLREPRYWHSAALLRDGRVLVAGGFGEAGEPLASTEIFNPQTSTWEAGPALTVPRARAALVVLADGNALITGGVTAGAARTASVELLPLTGAPAMWRQAAPLAVARQAHTATLLPNSKVLVAGGRDAQAVAATEIFDPVTGAWTTGPSLTVARSDHRAALLPAGVVALAGGSNESAAAIGEVEVFNPADGSLVLAGTAPPRTLHASALLPNGRVLAIGGSSGSAGSRLPSIDVLSIEALQNASGVLALSPVALQITASDVAITRVIAISNTGTGTLAWTAAANQPWLALNPGSGTAPGQLSVTVNPAGLAQGTYQATITLTSPDAANSPLAIPVALQVLPGTTMSLSAAAITVDTVLGVNAPLQIVSITNDGAGTLNWSASANASWIVLQPDNGTAPANVFVTLNTARLPVGTHRGEIIFSSRQAINGDQRVAVTVRVSQAPLLGLARSSLDVHAVPGRNPDPVSIAINNPTGLPLTWTAETNQPWVAVTGTGTAPGRATIEITSADLPVGRYEAEVVFTAPGASNSPRTLYVYLDVRKSFEPLTGIALPAGFYIVEATLAPGEVSGWWGMEVLAPRGSAGGFNLGGGLSGNADAPAFCAFNVETPQFVRARASVQGAGFTLQLRDPRGAVIGRPVSGEGQLTTEFAIPRAGFFILEMRSRTGAPVSTYQLGLEAQNFTGGLNTGGFIQQGTVGFGAFYLAQPQTVTIRLFGQSTAGPAGAGDLVLTVRDAARNVVRIVGP